MLWLKGTMMGAADAVPGVSGGTVAFMTGIYQELIYSINQCGPQALKILIDNGVEAAWKHVNGPFLITLLGGILFSLLTLSSIVLFLLDTYPELVWSFFFGLIVAAIWSLIRQIEQWKIITALAFFIGAVSAYLITSLTPSQIEPTYFYVFLSGMIAICAMILPGISGRFILLLLGMYSHILMALKNLEVVILGIFATGCVVGLLSFSRILNWMFSTHKTTTLALLGGFMLGSLNKVWPWKQTLETTLNRHGEEIPVLQENILPHTYETLSGHSAFLGYSITLMFVGIIIVLLLERLAPKPVK